ncbi:MAG: hypothetical protein IPK17_38170 [Chloroflexi bacterium]|uniref:hypothetical protein n=1 Tax=Candidatus Flexifilum breve TaxID=3140694 RepID=UPI0031348702|nr:hypothetical protein [Chloroflexota bacterium]
MGWKDIGAVLAKLREIVKTQITLLALEFVPPDQPVALPIKETASTLEAKAAPPAAAPAASADAPEPGTLRRSGTRGVGVRKALSSAAGSTANVTESMQQAFERIVPAPKEGRNARAALIARGGWRDRADPRVRRHPRGDLLDQRDGRKRIRSMRKRGERHRRDRARHRLQ